MGYVQDVLGNKNLVFQFEGGHKRDIITSLMSYICDKKEVCQEPDETLSGLPRRSQVGLLNFNEDPI